MQVKSWRFITSCGVIGLSPFFVPFVKVTKQWTTWRIWNMVFPIELIHLIVIWDIFSGMII
ncbi:hypothetical protein LINPERHAP2_LOCUS25187 [Linum perenne]